MADVKWIKIVTDIFDDEKILLIESVPEADSIIVIWFKLLTLAGKINNGGVLMFNDKLPYTDEMLATIFRRPINTVRLAIQTFKNFGMVEVINNTITIPNWSKHQTLDQLEERKEYMKNYMREYREKQKLLAEGEVNSKVNSKANVNSLEGEVEEDKEVDIEEEREGDIKEKGTSVLALAKDDINLIIKTWNKLNLQQLKKINQGTNRHSMLKARLKDYSIDEIIQAIESIKESLFLQGQNNRGWIVTFDWFIKPNNFIKVLEGNYIDKQQQKQQPKANKFHNFIQSDEHSGDDLERIARERFEKSIKKLGVKIPEEDK